jgi:NAD(P)-dependent dehydrogenase (short-subunit alcohol dehydrogenase family)
MARTVFEMRDAPLPDEPRHRITGRVLLLGKNADCDALANSLAAQGATILRLENSRNPEAASRELSRLCESGPPPTLILANCRAAERIQWSHAESWQERLEPALMVPFAICQKWFELALSTSVNPAGASAGDSAGAVASDPSLSRRPTLLAVTAMGGGLGFQTPIAAAESGGFAGLVKAIRAESQGRIHARVVDFPSDYHPQRLADAVIAELAYSQDDIEVGYDSRGRRSVVRGRFEPASSLPFEPLPNGSVWLVTGGARGVTALAARELGKRFQGKLHLVGSSRQTPLEPQWRGLPRDQWKSLRGEVATRARQRGQSPTDAWEEVSRQLELDHSLAEFTRAGVMAEYHTCDVADGASLERLLATIRGRDGHIDGVLHGAGLEIAASFPKKRWDNARKTLSVKAGGAAHLMRLLDDNPPRYFVAFSSVSGRFGGFGQTDYSMANDLLCKLVKQFADRHPRCRAVCLDWPAWDEIGMAARPESKFALQAMKVRFMPPSEGVEHLLDELQAGGRHTEVAFIDREGRAAHHAASTENAMNTAPSSSNATEAASVQPTSPSDRRESASHPGREFGLRHRAEIVEFVRLAADQWDDAARAKLALPQPLRQAFAKNSDEYLREVAAGAEVAIVSLLAHRPRSTVVSATAGNVTCFPLIESILDVSDAKLTARSLLRPEADPFLRDHLVHHKPFLPAVASVEILAEAASLLAPGLTFAGFRNLEFLQGQPFPTNAPIAVEAAVQRTVDGWECELTGPGVLGGDSRAVLVRGIAEFLPTAAEAPRLSVDEPNYRWNPFPYADRGYAAVFHGESLRTLKELAMQRDGGRARLAARNPLELAGGRGGNCWLTPSALLDGCFVACGTYAFIMLEGRYGLPRGIERLRLFGLPAEGEACRCRFTLREQNATGSWYDFHLVDAAGRCLLIAENHHIANLTRRA